MGGNSGGGGRSTWTRIYRTACQKMNFMEWNMRGVLLRECLCQTREVNPRIPKSQVKLQHIISRGG
jgi:hypothetical protein